MTARGPVRPGTLLATAVALLLLSAPLQAACPGRCSVRGGGSAASDCVVEFDGVELNHPPAAPRELRCTDGDPTCDADGAANGACAVRVAVCLNNADPELPRCAPSDVASFVVKNRRPTARKFDPQLQAIQDAVAALGLPTAVPACTAPLPVRVPLRTRRGRFRVAKKRVKTRALTAARVRDADRLRLACLPSPDFPGPDSVYARARVITTSAELIGGPLARGQLGDVLLANDEIQVVIQKAGRVMFGIGTYGGNIIDADLQRPSGEERDSFEELAPLINVENTANYTSVSVLNDGTNGMPAVVRATGPDDLLDFLNASSVIASLGLAFPASADDRDLPIEVQTDYVLEPGKPWVRMETTLTNGGALPLDLFFGDITNGSGEVELFQPTYGFGEPLVTHPACPASTFQPCTGGQCDLCNFIAWSGEGSAAGVSYGYIHQTNGSTTFSVSGVTVPTLGRQTVLVLVGVEPANFHLNPANTAGDAITFTRHFAVGNGSVGAIVDIRNAILGVSSTGTLAGVVATTAGSPVADAEVAVLGAPIEGGPMENVVDHFRTGVDGRYAGTLPAGSYTVRVNRDGRLAGSPDPAPVTVTAGATTTQDFTLGEPGRLRVDVTDQDGLPIPAKVQLVGFDPSPDPPNTQTIFGLVSNATGVFGTNQDGLVHGIAFVAFADRTGTTGTLDVEPGTYRLAVSRGPRYSSFTRDVTIGAGSTTAVAARLGRVIETPGFIAADFHVHALNSPDVEVSNADRVATMIAEGIDFFTPSDHDFRTDFAPVIAAMGVGDLVSTAPSAEITTFDYGHFNSWPVTIDPLALHGGGVDFGRAGIAPGFDFPSLGSFNLTPAEIYAAAHADPRPNLVQINHIRSFFSTEGLDIDTAEGGTGPPQSHAAPATRRLDPATPNLYSDAYETLELWIGDTGRIGDLEHFVGENLGDWFNLLNQGMLHSGVADSDTHTKRVTQINARTYVASAVTQPGLLAAEAETLAMHVAAGKATGTNAPFVTVTAHAASTGERAGLGVADSTILGTTDGTVAVTVTVKSPLWAEFDRIQFFVNNAPQPFDHDADAATRMRYRVIPDVEKVKDTDFTVTTVNDFPAVPGAQHLEATTTLDLAGLTADTWIVVLVRGTDGVSRPLFPFAPNSLRLATNTTLAQLTDGNLGEDGVLALAFTNPLYVDVNGGGWSPPGVMLTPP